MATLLSMMVKAINDSGQTRYQIAKGSGVSQAHLSRLVNGERGIGADSVQKLADYLGLEIVIQPKQQKKGK